MAKVTKSIVDKNLREKIFDDLFNSDSLTLDYTKINDRQYGVLLTDDNGTERYVRIGAIVAEEREDMTAQELMNSEIATYNEKQSIKAEKEKKKADKIAKDRAKREAEKAKEMDDE